MSLSVPSLATDSLYKFATLAGVALVGIGVYAIEREAGLKVQRIRQIGPHVVSVEAHQIRIFCGARSSSKGVGRPQA
jgi:hypothetical protein